MSVSQCCPYSLEELSACSAIMTLRRSELKIIRKARILWGGPQEGREIRNGWSWKYPNSGIKWEIDHTLLACITSYTQKEGEVPLQHSLLRICSSCCCTAVSSTPDPGTSTCFRCSQKKKKFKSLKTKIWRNFPLVAEVTVSRRKTMVRTYFCREEICTSSRNWKGSSSSVRWKCCCLSSGNQSKMLGFLRSQPSLRDLRYQKS